MAKPLPSDSISRDSDDIDVRLRRRRQVVVVRGGDSVAPLPPPPGRKRMPTLLGLDHRERQDTLYDEVVAPPDSRSRPAVLREDADEQIIEEYRREAARILGEGLFAECRYSSEYDISTE